MSRNRQASIMIFELGVIGQHGYFIKYLTNYWCEKGIENSLFIVVHPDYLDTYPEIVRSAERWSGGKIRFVPITRQEAVWIRFSDSWWFHKGLQYEIFTRHVKNRLRYFREWELCKAYAKKLKVAHCHVMTFDFYQPFIVFEPRLNFSLSAIYYRPLFHYPQFKRFSPEKKDAVKILLQKLLLFIMLKRSFLKTLFFLDPFAAEWIKKKMPRAKAMHLPEPVNLKPCAPEDVAVLRKELGIKENRKIFLLFGALGRRRGVHELLEAALMLPDDIGEKMCLLLIGPVNSRDKERVDSRVSEIRRRTKVQVVCRNEVIQEKDVKKYFELTDVVLLTHQKHIGSSGNLVLAAASWKPVLSSDYGLLGELVRSHQLGIDFDTTSSEEIKNGLMRFMGKDSENFFSRECARDFACMNSAKRYASNIIKMALAPDRISHA